MFDDSFHSANFWIMAPVRGYLHWFLAQDRLESYHGYHQHLQRYQAQSPGARLTLKAPAHNGSLLELLRVIPSARVVQLYRDPIVSFASVNSLFHTLHSVFARRVDPIALGQTQLHMLEQVVQRNHAARAQLPPNTVCDVQYDDLMADPVGVISSIYRHFDLEVSEEMVRAIQERVADRPQAKHERHTYCCAEFGMTDEHVRQRLSPGAAGR